MEILSNFSDPPYYDDAHWHQSRARLIPEPGRQFPSGGLTPLAQDTTPISKAEDGLLYVSRNPSMQTVLNIKLVRQPCKEEYALHPPTAGTVFVGFTDRYPDE